MLVTAASSFSSGDGLLLGYARYNRLRQVTVEEPLSAIDKNDE